ncbi:hypothetical protein STEG23_002814 [Scotinomys teguina]
MTGTKVWYPLKNSRTRKDFVYVQLVSLHDRPEISIEILTPEVVLETVVHLSAGESAQTQQRIFPDAVSWAPGHPSYPDTPLNIYEGGLGAQQQQGPGAQGSKPKNFRLRHLRSLALYLPGHMQPAGQCGSHWLGRLMAGGSLPRPEGSAWPLDLTQGTLSPGNSHCSTLLEAQLPRDSLGNTASSSSMDPVKGVPSQSGPPEGLGLRPKRSWKALEEAMCPLCKRTCFGALERT